MLIVLNAESSPSWVKPDGKANANEKLEFWTGFSLFRSPWVASPSSTTGRDGLGPLFNARSCDACHHNGAAGRRPGSGFGGIVRLSQYDDKSNRNLPLNNYGVQLQTLSIDSITGGNNISPEANLSVEYVSVDRIIDGKKFILKKPEIVFSDLAYGEMPEETLFSLRTAPPVFGLGIIDAISEKDILANEDVNDRDKNGISGKANWVELKIVDDSNKISIKSEKAVGRFGHKAEQPNLIQQIAGAFQQDIGITSILFANQNCTAVQSSCNNAPHGNSTEEGVELSAEKLRLTEQFVRLLKAPSFKSAKKYGDGRQLFDEVGCTNCHVEKFQITGERESPFKNREIYVYSDFLLHDMGDGLSDNRPVALANGNEWKTTPLWGIHRKLKTDKPSLLHDGRASNVREAVLWHGGESLLSVKAFLDLEQSDQEKLLQFVRNL